MMLNARKGARMMVGSDGTSCEQELAHAAVRPEEFHEQRETKITKAEMCCGV